MHVFFRKNHVRSRVFLVSAHVFPEMAHVFPGSDVWISLLNHWACFSQNDWVRSTRSIGMIEFAQQDFWVEPHHFLRSCELLFSLIMFVTFLSFLILWYFQWAGRPWWLTQCFDFASFALTDWWRTASEAPAGYNKRSAFSKYQVRRCEIFVKIMPGFCKMIQLKKNISHYDWEG